MNETKIVVLEYKCRRCGKSVEFEKPTETTPALIMLANGLNNKNPGEPRARPLQGHQCDTGIWGVCDLIGMRTDGAAREKKEGHGITD
jgi:hypothetical protein